MDAPFSHCQRGTISHIKLKHDIEQYTYLLEHRAEVSSRVSDEAPAVVGVPPPAPPVRV